MIAAERKSPGRVAVARCATAPVKTKPGGVAGPWEPMFRSIVLHAGVPVPSRCNGATLLDTGAFEEQFDRVHECLPMGFRQGEPFHLQQRR
jgi:hypothetical protein